MLVNEVGMLAAMFVCLKFLSICWSDLFVCLCCLLSCVMLVLPSEDNETRFYNAVL